MIDFMSGFYSALCFSSGIYFLTSRKRRAPFREAFGWLSLYCAVENLFYYAITNSGISNQMTKDTICACCDATIIPVLFLVMKTIVDQDMKTTPFTTRWLRVAKMEIPILICMAFCAFTRYEWRILVVGGLMSACIIALMSYSFIRFLRYEKQLSKLNSRTNASVKWVWYLVGLMLIEGVLYFAVGTYITYATYYFILCVIMCVATYFINKQSPIDTRILFKEVSPQDEEDTEEQLSETDSSYLTRKDMEMKVKHFMAQNPQFGKLIAERSVQKLTIRDLFLCILIIEGKRAGEIAETLAISQTSVEVARYRLRTKLNLNKGENLGKALKACLG